MDNFLADYGPVVTAHLSQFFVRSGKSQLLVVEMGATNICENLSASAPDKVGNPICTVINIHAKQGSQKSCP